MAAAPTFPLVGVVAPIVVSCAMWLVWGSPFALIGAVVGPVMVLAHFFDGRRRHRKETDRNRRDAQITAIAHQAEVTAVAHGDRAEANRRFPSVSTIVRSTDWSPSLDGDMLIRAGSETRDGISGFPWRVNVSLGISVVGEGVAHDRVIAALLVGVHSSHGPPAEQDDQTWHWHRGIRLSRFDDVRCGMTIRCDGAEVVSVSRRGEMPQRVDVIPDETTGWRSIVERLSGGDDTVEWNDRVRCPTGVGLDGMRPVEFTPSSLEPHIAVVGRTGSGKSEFLASLISDWAERLSPDKLSWIGFDFKGGATLSPLSGLSSCRGIETDLDLDNAARAWVAVEKEILRREAHLRDESVSRIEDSVTLSRLVVVIDEYPELLRQLPSVAETVGGIARRGRSLGIHLVISTQHVGALTRDGLLANLTTRVCFPLGSAHDIVMFLGSTPIVGPRCGRPLIVHSDGSVRQIRVRFGAENGEVNPAIGPRLPPLWSAAPRPPVFGTEGFGIIDDATGVVPRPATWHPADGDVIVVGARGSGRSTAIAAFTRGHAVTAVHSVSEILEAHGVVVIDDIDRIHAELPDDRKHELSISLDRRRREVTPPVFVMSTANWAPRIHGVVGNVLTLATHTCDEHRVTGEPATTFKAQTPPGVASWKGQRVVVYASTDSIDTESMP